MDPFSHRARALAQFYLWLLAPGARRHSWLPAAVYDNCNSLHTDAYDEAVTTPTRKSVRRAMAIQLIINKEWGLALHENANQGSLRGGRAVSA